MTERHYPKENDYSGNPVAQQLLRAETVHIFPEDKRLSFLHPTTIRNGKTDVDIRKVI